jgi:tetratricopeptide (TPR) repeat protein
MTRRAAALALLGLWGCATPLELGEEHYRVGDRRGALEIWRAVPRDDRDYPEVVRRVEQVESEFSALVRGYQESARSLEEQGRLAEALLDYRLALVLEPDDPTSWAHVQELARELRRRKAEQEDEYQRLRGAGQLQEARTALVRLRTLDPFEPAFEIEERELQVDLAREHVRRKAALADQYRERLSKGDLQAARASLLELRTLDPFDPELEIEERQLEAGLALEAQKQRARPRNGGAAEGEVEGLIEAGRTAFAEERLETALVLWRQAQRIDPDNERVKAYIERAERELDRLARLRNEPGANEDEAETE